MMMISFYKDANQERKFLGLTLQPNKHRLQDYVKYQQQDYESDILEKRESRRNAENNMNHHNNIIALKCFYKYLRVFEF